MGAASKEDVGKDEGELEAEAGTEPRAGVVGVGLVRSISGAGTTLVVEEVRGREGGEIEVPVEEVWDSLVDEGSREVLGREGAGDTEVGETWDS